MTISSVIYLLLIIKDEYSLDVDRSQRPRGLRRGSATARLLGLRFRILRWAYMSVSCECCVLSARCLCIGLTIRPEESY